MISMLVGRIDIPLVLLLFSLIADTFSGAAISPKVFHCEDVDPTLLLAVLSEFPGASLSDESDDSCCRCIIRLDSLFSELSDRTWNAQSSNDTPPTGNCKCLF